MTKGFGFALVNAVLVIIILSIAIAGGILLPPVAFAAEGTDYSDVLDDLSKDENFSTEHYPSVVDDYSLKVIQIAESSDNELFVYVYQPSGEQKNLVASSINIALVPRENISDVRNYKLRLLNSDGVFYKYLVEGLTVSSATTKYYTISNILRPWNGDIDPPAEGGNTVTEVPYSVAKEYCFSTINGEPFCRVLDIETIEITDKFVGYVRYKDGYQGYLGGTACDSHFVAFDTDRRIDKLYEADVYYSTQSVLKESGTVNKTTFREKKDNYVELNYTQKVEHTGGGLFAPTYEWDRIETVDQFIQENSTYENVYSGALFDVTVGTQLTPEAIESLKGKKWVLRFTETEYGSIVGPLVVTESSTIVGDVMILRLKFETDGITYNLGVVDNKQSGDPDVPSGGSQIKVEPNDPFKKVIDIILFVLALIFIIILLVLLAPILPYIIKFVIWVISLPFRLIAALFKAIRKRKRELSVKGKSEIKDYDMPHIEGDVQTVNKQNAKASKYKRKT